MIVFVDPKNFNLELYSIFFCLCHDPEVPVRYTMAISFFEVSLQWFFVTAHMGLFYFVFFFKFMLVTVNQNKKTGENLLNLLSLSRVFSSFQPLYIAHIHSLFSLSCVTFGYKRLLLCQIVRSKS